jgi:cell shape-determining protein MreC
MLVLASATIITLDYKGDAHQTITSVRNAARDVVSPAQRLIADILHPVGDLFSGSVNYGDAQAQIVRLQLISHMNQVTAWRLFHFRID